MIFLRIYSDNLLIRLLISVELDFFWHLLFAVFRRIVEITNVNDLWAYMWQILHNEEYKTVFLLRFQGLKDSWMWENFLNYRFVNQNCVISYSLLWLFWETRKLLFCYFIYFFFTLFVSFYLKWIFFTQCMFFLIS